MYLIPMFMLPTLVVMPSLQVWSPTNIVVYVFSMLVAIFFVRNDIPYIRCFNTMVRWLHRHYRYHYTLTYVCDYTITLYLITHLTMSFLRTLQTEVVYAPPSHPIPPHIFSLYLILALIHPYTEQTTTLEIKAHALKKYPVVLEVYLLHNLVTDPFRPFGIDALNVHYTLSDIKGG